MELYQNIDNALQLGVVFLHDDAKFAVNTKNNSNQHLGIFVKTLRSIATGLSWYESLGFRPIDCPADTWNIQGQEGKYYHQKVHDYRTAIHNVQHTDLKVIKHFYSDMPVLKKKWEKFFC
eukprot:UN23742